MIFPSPIPRGGRVYRSETSPLVSRRDPLGPGSAWKADNQNARTLDQINNSVGSVARNIARTGNVYSAGDMHPFRIYRFPRQYRSFLNNNDYLRYKVRGGRSLQGGYQALFGTTLGTDGCDVPSFGSMYSSDYDNLIYQPDQISYPIPLAQGGFQTVPTDGSLVINSGAGAQTSWSEALTIDGTDNFFWISLCAWKFSISLFASGPIVCYGTSNVGATELFTGQTFTDPWPLFPLNDPYHKLIGVVHNFSGKSMVNQIIKSDVSFPNQSTLTTIGLNINAVPERFCGEYNAGAWYWYGDKVTRTTTVSGKTVVSVYVYYDIFTTYTIVNGPITGIDPDTNSPNPWTLLSKSFVDATYEIASYDASKAYLRTP
jgi:hypothetical protein